MRVKQRSTSGLSGSAPAQNWEVVAGAMHLQAGIVPLREGRRRHEGGEEGRENGPRAERLRIQGNSPSLNCVAG